MSAATMASAELLALANRIKKANSISLMEQPQKPGPLWAMPLGNKEQAAIVAALRLAAKPTEEREATIEECAKASITPLTDAQKDNAKNGFGALLRFEAIWNLAQRTSAAAVRALSTAQASKP